MAVGEWAPWAVTLVAGLPLVVLLFRKLFKRGPEAFPEDGVFDLKTLARFDGVKNPICMAVCGKVIDVSSSDNIKHGEGYGKLWAGKDATYSLATLSLKEEDANTLNFKLSDFTEDQHKALAGWYKHFTTKYNVIGRLKEYEGWDWTSIEEEAKHQKPFASAAGKDEDAKATPEAEKVGSQKPDAGVILKKGERVVLKGLDEAQKDMEGATGVLQNYSPDKGGFEVVLDSTGKTEVFKPSNLAKP
mmetsp:Transcript_15914/g.40509  ORF Transcript_15914/g.40509 Transcript_15914/m.40509 type:complete len:245 (-) Transcript_15914:194-928(-)